MNNLLEIDFRKVQKNISMAQKEKQACLMVKADCYGLGNKPIKKLIKCGYNFFGVSTLEEALSLRKLNSQIEIMIFSYTDIADLDVIKENNIIITVYDLDMLSKINKDIRFHLKFDTNMGRIGFKKQNVQLVKELISEKELKAEGVYTHFACASDEDKTKTVIDEFKSITEQLKSLNLKLVHMHNSFASINYDTDFDNMIRLGIGMWGYLADENELKLSKQKYYPAISLKATVSLVKEYEGYISYGHTQHVKGIVATITLGYRDGLNKKLKNYKIKGVGEICGQINMCQAMILINEGLEIKKGQYIDIFRNEQLYDVCEYSGYTTYEFLTSLSDRIKISIVEN